MFIITFYGKYEKYLTESCVVRKYISQSKQKKVNDCANCSDPKLAILIAFW